MALPTRPDYSDISRVFWHDFISISVCGKTYGILVLLNLISKSGI